MATGPAASAASPDELKGLVVQPGLKAECTPGVWFDLAKALHDVVQVVGHDSDLAVSKPDELAGVRRLGIAAGLLVDGMGPIPIPLVYDG
jgi:hypothetical protein